MDLDDRRRQVPNIVVSRLPLYLRALTHLADRGQAVTSSLELGRTLSISPAQIRKDLSYFGEFGKQGMGYEVDRLIRALSRILQLDRSWDVALIGAGHLGTAIAHYAGFTNRGFRITAVFDAEPSKVGQRLGRLTVRPMDDLETWLARSRVGLAIVAVPASAAQEVTDRLVRAGIKAILNYAPINLEVPPEVRIHHIDPLIGLQAMTYYL